jgi:hypothetical protein
MRGTIGNDQAPTGVKIQFIMKLELQSNYLSSLEVDATDNKQIAMCLI